MAWQVLNVGFCGIKMQMSSDVFLKVKKKTTKENNKYNCLSGGCSVLMPITGTQFAVNSLLSPIVVITIFRSTRMQSECVAAPSAAAVLSPKFGRSLSLSMLVQCSPLGVKREHVECRCSAPTFGRPILFYAVKWKRNNDKLITSIVRVNEVRVNGGRWPWTGCWFLPIHEL